MLDPDNIIIVNKNENTTINLNHVIPYEDMIWDLDDEKDYKKYVKVVESESRHSIEYQEMIKFMKNNYDMNRCAFLHVSGENNPHVKIEIHHYPFTLSDIVEIVIRKRQYYQESLEVELVAKEVTMIHFKLLVGLVPLSRTAHQLYHDSKLFIPLDSVLGQYDLFSSLYEQFIDPYQMETLRRLKEASMIEENDLHNNTILESNPIHIEAKDPEYILPDITKVETGMYQRIDDIKSNNYRLPTFDDYQILNKEDKAEDRRAVVDALVFFK